MVLFNLEVTEEDIRNGKRGSETKCPVALALKRKFPDAFLVHASADEDCQCMGVSWFIRVQSHKGSISMNLHSEVSKKLSEYDRVGTMDPFSFDVIV